jgi:hypothetical protein
VDSVVGALVDDQRFWRGYRVEMVVGEADIAEVVVFARDDEIGPGDLLAEAIGGQTLRDPIDLFFRVGAGHVHKTELERRAGRFKERKAAGLKTGHDHGTRGKPALRGRELRCEKRAEAPAEQQNPVRVEFVAPGQCLVHSRAKLPVRVRVIPEPPGQRFTLAGSIYRQHSKATVEEAIAVHRDGHLLEGVHAGDGHDARQQAGLRPGRQVEVGRHIAPAERDLKAHDGATSLSHERAVALRLLAVEQKIEFRVGFDCPLSCSVEHRSREITLSRRCPVASVHGVAGEQLAAASRLRELARQIVVLSDARPHGGEIDLGVLTTGSGVVRHPALIPFGTNQADHGIQQPALARPA